MRAGRTPSSSSRPTAARFGGLGAARFARHSPDRSAWSRSSTSTRSRATARRGSRSPATRPARRRRRSSRRRSRRVAEQSGARRRAAERARPADRPRLPVQPLRAGPVRRPRHPGHDDHDRRRPAAAGVGDTPTACDATQLGQVGRAAQELVGSLDQGLELAQGTTSSSTSATGSSAAGRSSSCSSRCSCRSSSAPSTCSRTAGGGASRSRRRCAACAAASSSGSGSAALFGSSPARRVSGGAARPVDPGSAAARQLAACSRSSALGAARARSAGSSRAARLVPRRPVTPEERLAGHTAALLALGVVALLVVAHEPVRAPLPAARRSTPGSGSRSCATRRRRRAWLCFLPGLLGPAAPARLVRLPLRPRLDAPWYLARARGDRLRPVPAIVDRALLARRAPPS